MTETLEAALSALTDAQLHAVAAATLDALRVGPPPATDAELDGIERADRAVLSQGADQFGLDATDSAAQPRSALIQALLLIAGSGAEGRQSVETALARATAPQSKLPIFGLGGLELIALAVAAAIVRPSLEVARDADGGTRLKIEVQGTDKIVEILRALLGTLRP